MKAKLLLLEPEASRSEITLSLPAKIGRGEEAKFKLVHARVSRLHCEIFAQGDQVMVRDFASLNGTFVNDERVIDEAAIPSGGILQVGAAKFQVLYGEDFDRSPSPPAKKAQPGAEAVRKAAAKTSEAAEAGELDELWGSMDEQPAGAAAGEGPELLNFLDEEPPVKPKPAAKGKAAAGKKGTKKEAAEKPADKPAAEESAAEPDEGATAEPSTADSPAAEDEELKMAPKEATAKDKPVKKDKPKKASGGEGEEDDEGLDDFLKSIM